MQSSLILLEHEHETPPWTPVYLSQLIQPVNADDSIGQLNVVWSLNIGHTRFRRNFKIIKFGNWAHSMGP